MALALPWLESWVRPARAGVSPAPKRFVAIYLPNGAPDIWPPPAEAPVPWQLTSVLAPLAALKSKVTLISGLENGSAFNASGSSSVEPSHGRMCAGWLTCVDAQALSAKTGNPDANGVSLDQIMARHAAFAGKTPIASLQVGLSSMYSACEPNTCSLSRSVSWDPAPMYKTVDPNVLFKQLTGAGPGTGLAQSPAQRDSRASVLDAVQETAGVVRTRLNPADKHRLDEYLDAVRTVEKRVKGGVGPLCNTPMQPNFPAVTDNSFTQNMGGYSKAVHADLINELLALALQCDQTRVATYMLEDERSDFLYDFIPRRTFTHYTSEPSNNGFCPTWHNGAMNGAPDDYASVVHWHVGKVAEFCQRLAGMLEYDGQSVLDNSVVMLGGSMHGASHACENLPTLTVGGGGGSLATDQYLALTRRPLRDFYYTLMNGVFGMNVTDFGANLTGAPLAVIPELLA